uniref:Ribosomal protein n=1 Tax=candidate division CPR3 bacterium TaxID=2268181 RepID=A0A7C5YRQ6_UNCC3
MKRSKKYRKILEELKKQEKPKDLKEAVSLVKKAHTAKFTGAIELHISTKSKEKEYTVRGTVAFPHQFGKEKKVVVICEEKDKEKALKNGADYAGLNDIIQKIQEEKIEMDVVLATPNVMSKVAILGKVLGPKGLMPNPKSNTIITSFDIIKGFKAGKTTFKSDKNGNIHLAIGKIDQDDDKIVENIKTAINSIREACSRSNAQIRKLYIAPTMGPSIEITNLI